MALEIRKLHPLFGAEIFGVEAQDGLDEDTAKALRKAVAEHGVLVLRNQYLTDREFEHLASYFGPLYRVKPGLTLPSTAPNVFRLSNVDAEGNILEPSARIREVNLANQLWHTDFSSVRPRAAYSMLYGRVLPPEGANTDFADTRCAYDALSADMRETVSQLFAIHSMLFSRSLKGFASFTSEQRNELPPIRRPLVYTQPETGRKALNLASHVCDIEGYEHEDGISLINQLIDHATAPERVYSHHWTLGDLLMWDNRCTMHRATPFEEFAHVRDMRALRIVDRADA